MDQVLQERAGVRLDEALASASSLDPRESLRTALRTLKESQPEAFGAALRYYEEVLVPRVAEPTSDPLAEWRRYGLEIARQVGAGRLVGVDASGRASDAAETESAPPATLLLFLPQDARAPALLLSGPAALSPPQQAATTLLVHRKLTL
jgi:hypothetical protein